MAVAPPGIVLVAIGGASLERNGVCTVVVVDAVVRSWSVSEAMSSAAVRRSNMGGDVCSSLWKAPDPVMQDDKIPFASVPCCSSLCVCARVVWCVSRRFRGTSVFCSAVAIAFAEGAISIDGVSSTCSP